MSKLSTNADRLKQMADSASIPLRTLGQVKADLADAKRRSVGKNAGLDVSMAKLMLKHGRLTDEAVLYIGDTYPEVWED